MEPDVTHDLRRHPDAAEWQYVLGDERWWDFRYCRNTFTVSAKCFGDW